MNQILIDIIVATVANLISGKVFSLGNLLKEKKEWKNLSKGEKVKAGKEFKKYVSDNRIANVRIYPKKNANVSVYIKTGEDK